MLSRSVCCAAASAAFLVIPAQAEMAVVLNSADATVSLNRAANTISLVDWQRLTVVESIAVPSGPDCIDVSRDGKEAWVTARWAREVSVVDLASRKVVRSIPVGRSPHGVFLTGNAPRE